MRAYQILAPGVEPGLNDIAIPVPKKGQVRLDIKACGLNFADLLMQGGTYQDMPSVPFTLGMEIAGVVNTVGPDTTGARIGDRVLVFCGHGGLAEQGCFDVNRLLPLPHNMSFADAAAFQIAYGTSHVALGYRANLKPGETLLVLGAAGGVGLTAVEIGKAMGATVIACARGAEKLKIAAKSGADHLIDTEADDLRTVVKDLGGADVVYDPVGGDLFAAAFRACNPEARILTIGFASGDIPKIPANHLLVKNISVLGFYWGGYMSFKPEIIMSSLTELLGWYSAGRIKPHISHLLPLDQVAQGMGLLRARKSIGKIVISI